MRLDRFLTLNLVQPFRRSLLRIGWGEGGRSPDEVHVTRYSSLVASLPILMFHSISDDSEPGVRSYYRVCTSPRRFREQMQWLKNNGYQGVALSEGLSWLNSKSKMEDGDWKVNSLSARHMGGEGRGEMGSLDSRHSKLVTHPVALTFDDGFRDFYTAAWPVLREYGFTATMYLPTAFIGSKSEIGNRKSEILLSPSECHSSPVTRHNFRGRDCLTWAEANELHRAGIEFGSHTVHHPELVNLAWPEIESEIRDSKSEIENRLGVPCPAFAYPYAFPQGNGDFVGRIKDLLAASGYETNVTTQIGRHRPGDDTLQIKRLPVNQNDDLPLFAAKLGGAYDWLAFPQGMIKKLKPRKHVPVKSGDGAAQPAPSSPSAPDPQLSDS